MSTAGGGRPGGWVRSTFRTQLWWSAKVLPTFGVALLAAVLAESAPDPGRSLLFAMLVSAAGIAGASHLINDWADIEADQRANKPNMVAHLTTSERLLLLALAAVLGIGPWLLVQPSSAVIALLASLLLLPILYSVPPVRLKARGRFGIAADAADAHVAPTLLAFSLMVDAGEPTRGWVTGVLAAVLWSAGLGVRSILNHQVLDLANDEAARVPTYVASTGTAAAIRLGRSAFATELIGLAGLGVAIMLVNAWIIIPFALYAAVWTADHRWTGRSIEAIPDAGSDWLPLVEFYQVWPTVIFAATLVFIDPAWWPVPVVILVLFGPAVVKQSIDLWRMLRSAFHDLRAAAVRMLWWIRRSMYWPLCDLLGSVGHFRRRQGRRVRRHWRMRRSPGSPTDRQ